MAKGVQKAWSVTAADNDDSDETTNWAEGQAPSTVNNSARAMMAAVKAFANQIAGGATYGGSSNAYTITSDSPGTITTAYAAGMMFMLKASHTNNGAATLNVDGVGAVAIKTSDGGDVVSGDIVQNGLYLLAYNSTGPRFDLIGTIAGGSFQPLDATLTAFAALAHSSGNQFPYFTGTDAFSLGAITANGLSLVGAANYAAMRALLDLEAGTDFYSISATDTLLNAKASLAGATFTGDVVMNGGANALTLGGFTATAGADIAIFMPSNFAAGNPAFYISKSSTASIWNLTLFDSVNTAGTINIGSTLFTHGGSTVLTAANYTAQIATLGAITFNGDLTLQQNDPLILFDKSNASTNQRWWGFDFGTDGQFNIFMANTAFSAFANLLTFTRSGVTPLLAEFGVDLVAPIADVTGVSGTLTTSHRNRHLELSGGVTLPNSVFTAGDKQTFDPGTSNRTFTRGSGIAMYVNGSDASSATLAANQLGSAHWRSASVVVLSGAFS